MKILQICNDKIVVIKTIIVEIEDQIKLKFCRKKKTVKIRARKKSYKAKMKTFKTKEKHMG